MNLSGFLMRADRSLRPIVERYGGWQRILDPQFQPPGDLYKALHSVGYGAESLDILRRQVSAMLALSREAAENDSGPSARIRSYTEADFNQLQTLWHKLIQYHQELDPERHDRSTQTRQNWDSYFRQCIRSDSVFFKVAEIERRLVGFVSFRMFGRRKFATIENIFVSPEVRSTGVGKLLLASAEDAIGPECHISLRCEAKNLNAFDFYVGLGYQQTVIELAKAPRTQPEGQD